MASTTQEMQEQAPWHAAYPDPKADVVFLSREDVLALLLDPQAVAGKDYVLIDLRRNDHHVRCAPAVIRELNINIL